MRHGYFCAVAHAVLELKKRGLMLLPEGGLWMPERDMILISDVHIGKATHFRKHGIPVPQEVENSNLKKLSRLMATYAPRQLVVLGDLFHGEAGCDSGVFSVWRAQWNHVAMTLVRGNHDKGSEDYCKQNSVQLCVSMKLGDVILKHDAGAREQSSGAMIISGHLHPGFRVGLKHYPCFWYSPGRLILPAFGAFTGFFRVKPGPGHHIFVSFNEQLWPLAF